MDCPNLRRRVNYPLNSAFRAFKQFRQPPIAQIHRIPMGRLIAECIGRIYKLYDIIICVHKILKSSCPTGVKPLQKRLNNRTAKIGTLLEV